MIKTAKRIFPIGRGMVALGLAAMLAGTVYAQDAAGPDDGLTIPSDLAVLQDGDDTVRRAAVIVNGEVITRTDIKQRLALILAANKGAVSPEEEKRLRMQVLRNLIDETLQIQEARAEEIQVEPEAIEQTYLRVASENFGQNVKAMDDYLTGIGSSPRSLKRQIEGEMAWQRLLGRNIQPFVNVSNEEVQEVMDRMQASRGTAEYRLGEIYLSASPENRPAVHQNAVRIVEQLKQGGSFIAYARQFSEASTAAVGGDLGWIRLAQLPVELSTVASSMERGQLVGPVEVPGGFSILYLIDKRQVLTADPRDAVLSLKQISIDFPKGTSQDIVKQRVAALSTAVSQTQSCDAIDGVADQIGATVIANNGIKVRELPPQLQELLLSLQIGQATPPFGAPDDGLRMLMVCGRDETAMANGPSFDQLMSQIEDDRVGKRAQRYLRDLRRDAVIDFN